MLTESIFTEVAIRYLVNKECNDPRILLNEVVRQRGLANEVCDVSEFKESTTNYLNGISLFLGEDCSKISNAVNELISAYNEYASQVVSTGNYYPNDDVVLKYLDAYSILLKHIYLCNVEGKTSIMEGLIARVYQFASSKERNSLSIFSPIVVSAFYMFVENLNEYVNCNEFTNLKDEKVKTIYAHLFAQNANQRLVAWILLQNENNYEICKTTSGINGEVDIINLNKSCGIVSVEPICLLEKIVSNYKYWQKLPETEKRDEKEFTIGVIGSIRGNKDEVERKVNELLEMLASEISVEPTVKVSITWYCENQDATCEYQKDGITIRFEDYFQNEMFAIKKNGGYKLSLFMDNSDLMFFIDCTELYSAPRYEHTQDIYHMFTYKVKESSYSFSYDFNKYGLEDNLYNKGLIVAHMNLSVGQVIDGEYAEHGKIVHCANAMLVEAIQRFVEKSTKYKESVFMFSSDTAISSGDYYKYHMRREEYNSKVYPFDNFSFANGGDGSESYKHIDVGNPEGVLKFSLYDLLERFGLEVFEDECITSLLYRPKEHVDKVTTMKRAKAVTIGLYYKPYARAVLPTKLNLYIKPDTFYVSDIDDGIAFAEKITKDVKEFVYNVLLPTYKQHPAPYKQGLSIYIKYTNKIYTLLLKSSQNISDIMYCHLHNHRTDKCYLEIGDIANDNFLIQADTDFNMYIEKKCYWDVMRWSDDCKKNFDATDCMLKNIKAEVGSTFGVLTNIGLICRNFNYENSYLCENIQEALELLKTFKHLK